MRDLSVILCPVLMLLLIVLTPVGSGEGAHRDQLLDPLFPDIHLTGPLAPGLTAQRATVVDTSRGPAIGAGAGAASASLGAGLLQRGNWTRADQSQRAAHSERAYP
jgi:hypothetical protein